LVAVPLWKKAFSIGFSRVVIRFFLWSGGIGPWNLIFYGKFFVFESFLTGVIAQTSTDDH
jgi:hypothetical protein